MLASLKKYFTKQKQIVQTDLTGEIATRQALQSLSALFHLLPDPDPILKKIGKDVSVYNDLRNDSHVYSVEQQRKSGLLEMDWQLNRNDASDAQYKIIQDFFSGIDVYNLIDQMLNSVFFGLSVFELVWEKNGSYLLPAKIEEKPREWFFFDDMNNPMLRKTTASANFLDGTPLNPFKFILVQHKPSYANPYGDKALSRCFWPVTFKRGGLKFWVTFTEKFGMPYLIGKLPRGLDKQKYDDLKDVLDLMVQDACAVIPDDASVEIKDFQRAASVDVFERLVYFMNSEISKAILTQTLTTEVQDKATHAASSTQADMRTSIIKSDKRLVENAFNQLIALIYAVNFGEAAQPSFELYVEEDVDKTLAERDEILTRTGVAFTKDYFIKNYNFADSDFEVSSQPKTQPQSSTFAAVGNDRDRSASAEELIVPPDKLLQLQIEQTLKPVLSLVNSASSFEEINKNLALLYPELNTDQLESLLQKAIFFQQLNGRTD